RHDVRPAVLHHHPRHREEREALDDEGQVDIHDVLRAPALVAQALANAESDQPAIVDRNGLAKISSSAMATPMIGTASSRPATMNILVCSIGVSSGWRAEPSMNLPPRMAKPMAVPRAPRPISRPAAITVNFNTS